VQCPLVIAPYRTDVDNNVSKLDIRLHSDPGKIMKTIILILIANMLLIPPVIARDSIGSYSIDEVMSLEKSKSALGNDISFYFGGQKHSKIEKNFGEYKSNRKTNAFNKTDKEACQWVFLSAMKSLRDRARSEGGNAVINIKSNYKNNLTSSDDSFQCGAGALIAGVALVGSVVKLKE